MDDKYEIKMVHCVLLYWYIHRWTKKLEMLRYEICKYDDNEEVVVTDGIKWHFKF